MSAGRPRLEFDWDLVDSLVIVEASEAYIAERLIIKDGEEVNAKSIQSKIKLIQRRILERFECNFVQYREQKLEDRKRKLREWQWKAAEKGNVVMLIWLGKNYLNQSDKQEVKAETHATNVDMKADEYERRLIELHENRKKREQST